MIGRKLFILFFIGSYVNAQDAIHNFGTLQLHNNSSIGFHTDFINDGILEQNSGLAGFYGYNRSLTMYGAFAPIFYDTEVFVDDDFFLETSIEVKNNVNFITGNVVTPRENPDVSVVFQENAFYNGDQNSSKTDGYVSIYNKDSFVFPIGDYDRLRPLELNSEEANRSAQSAYFYENPSSPVSINEIFDTDQKTELLTEVSNNEFWVLQGSVPSIITLSWDSYSQILQLVDNPGDVRVVGWHTTDGIWQDLGNTNFSGDLDRGSITSESFVPNEYSAITFGTRKTIDNVGSAGNIVLTPNNDGAYDYLDLEVVQDSPNNHLTIYNRWGKLVYSKENYRNTFDGTSNVNFVITKGNGLPEGIYFYIIKLFDLDTMRQGYLYLDR